MLASLVFASNTDGDDFANRPRDHDRARLQHDLRETRRDQRWVESLLGPDIPAASAALSSAVRAYFDRLVRFAYGFVGSSDAAEDIVQDTFVRVWETRHTLRLDASFRSYLFTTVRRRALNVLKHADVEHRYATNVQATTEPLVLAADDHLDADLVERAVRTAIARLPERRRTVIRLRYEEGLPFQAVAEIMGISEKAAKDLTARAIREIRSHITIEEE